MKDSLLAVLEKNIDKRVELRYKSNGDTDQVFIVSIGKDVQGTDAYVTVHVEYTDSTEVYERVIPINRIEWVETLRPDLTWDQDE